MRIPSRQRESLSMHFSDESLTKCCWCVLRWIFTLCTCAASFLSGNIIHPLFKRTEKTSRFLLNFPLLHAVTVSLSFLIASFYPHYSPSFFAVINVLHIFCLNSFFPVLQPGLAVSSTSSFHWLLSLRFCFVFSGRARCVYPAQIHDLFITVADLAGAQAS